MSSHLQLALARTRITDQRRSAAVARRAATCPRTRTSRLRRHTHAAVSALRATA